MRTTTGLWRSTPPAIFPVTLGALGLGVIWRKAAIILPVPTAVGDLLMGVSTAFFLFFLASYIAKLMARPGVLLEDLKTPPARAGISAIGMSLMLLAAVLLNFGWELHWLWWAGVAVQIAISVLVLMLTRGDQPELRGFSPFQYLTYVGLIVAPIAGVPMGYEQISFWLAMAALVGFVVVTLGYGAKLIRVRPPQPLRPSLVIVLSPLSLFGLMFLQMGAQPAFMVFYWLSWAAALVLLGLAFWLTKGGFTPIWGAFTFPVAAFTSLQISATVAGASLLALPGAVLGLAVGTPLILFVAYRAAQAWSRGELAKKTGAATA